MTEQREMIAVYLEVCHPEAKVPCYARLQDAGMDLYAVEDTPVKPGQTVIVRTGLKMAVPSGYELQICPRSGMSLNTFLRVANSPGTIDSGYRDEVGIIMHNTSQEKEYLIKKGDRVAQMVLQKVPGIQWIPVDDILEIGGNRGGGFGSSGR